MDSLKTCNAKLLPSNTFINFKLHMREEHHALREVGALSIRDSKLLQANMIQQLTDCQDKLTQDLNLQYVHTMQETFPQAMNILHTTNLNSDILPSTQQVNNITTDSKVTNAQLFTFPKSLPNKVDRLEINKSSTHIETTSNINPRTRKYFCALLFLCGCFSN